MRRSERERNRRVLDDRAMLGLAAVTWIGAWHPARLPLIAAVIITTISLIGRRPVLLGLGLLLAASPLAQRAHEGLEPPVAGPFEGIATLVADPVDIGFGTRADVRIDGQRHELRAMNA